MVPSYQPEASLRLFERALFHRDMATGTVDLRRRRSITNPEDGEGDEIFRTEGPRDTWWRRNEVLPVPEGRCYVLNLMTCSADDVRALRDGRAIVEDWVVVGVVDEHSGAGEEEEEEDDGGVLVDDAGEQVVIDEL